MLQTLSRVYWMTGNRKYLDWAVRLGDYYLFGGHHPTRDEEILKLRDHGCEIVSGLCELYATLNYAVPVKKSVYRAGIHEMLDYILQFGRDEHGLFYNGIYIRTSRHDRDLADTWGYDLNGFYTVYLIDKTDNYRQAVLRALGSLNDYYKNYPWEGTSADGYADSIEGAINLYNREPVDSAARWIDSEIKVMWDKQQPNGIIEGWHGDGNFARTTIMYCLWKTKGLTIRPWRDDVVFGASAEGDSLQIYVSSDRRWQGKLLFDTQRHKTIMKLPIDWPRINQFPEWFTVEQNKRYLIRDLSSNTRKSYTAQQMAAGIDISVQAGVPLYLTVQ
jgi:hypothetical protein